MSSCLNIYFIIDLSGSADCIVWPILLMQNRFKQLEHKQGIPPYNSFALFQSWNSSCSKNIKYKSYKDFLVTQHHWHASHWNRLQWIYRLGNDPFYLYTIIQQFYEPKLIYYPSQTSVDKGFFFGLDLQGIGFSLQRQTSGNVMTVLQCRSMQNTDHVTPFWLLALVAAKEKTANWRDVKNKDRSKLY